MSRPVTDPNTLNPYAPPQLAERPGDRFEDGLVWRMGTRLLLRSGAALPPRCFVTGEPTRESVAIRQVWHPNWVYLLLFAGVLPYFLVSPVVSRHVSLRIPIARSIYAAHMRKVHIGLVLSLIGLTLGIVGGVAGRLVVGTSALVSLGIMLGLLGVFLSSRQPASVHIERLQGDWMILRNIHPHCLADLPEAEGDLPDVFATPADQSPGQ